MMLVCGMGGTAPGKNRSGQTLRVPLPYKGKAGILPPYKRMEVDPV